MRSFASMHADYLDPSRHECDIPLKLSETHPVARREHICASCGKPIKKGERYYRFVGIDVDGKFFSHKAHAHYACSYEGETENDPS